MNDENAYLSIIFRSSTKSPPTEKIRRRFRLSKSELERIERLLKRSVDKESGKSLDDKELSEDNPDGRKSFYSQTRINSIAFRKRTSIIP